MDNFSNIIEITSGAITISDPCYGLNTWCQAENIEFPNGRYYTDYVMSNDSEWGARIAEIEIYSTDLSEQDKSNISWTEINKEIGVDSGQAGIFDAEYYKKYHTDPNGENKDYVDDDWYDEVCNLTLDMDNDRAGIIDEKGFVSSSGYGDGGYTAYIGKLNDKIVSAKVVFISDENEPENEDWTELEEEGED